MKMMITPSRELDVVLFTIKRWSEYRRLTIDHKCVSYFLRRYSKWHTEMKLKWNDELRPKRNEDINIIQERIYYAYDKWSLLRNHIWVLTVNSQFWNSYFDNYCQYDLWDLETYLFTWRKGSTHLHRISVEYLFQWAFRMPSDGYKP